MKSLKTKILFFLGSLVLTALILSLTISCSGKKYTLSTDSTEIIFDGFPMQAYTIDGTRVICIEDLAAYGFTVTPEEGKINAVGDESIVQPPDTSGITRNIYEIAKAYDSRKKIQVNSMTIKGYESGNKHYVSLDGLCSFRSDYNNEWGYSDYNFVSRNENGKIIVDVFRLKILDQTAQWSKLNEMVNKPEIEVYTEDYSKQSVPYYGQRLEPSCGVLAGVNGDDVFESDYLGASLNYVEFNDFQKDILRPNKDYVKASSCMVVVAWNIDDLMAVFDNEKYIRETLNNLQKYHKPIIIRIGAEMNVSHIGDAPAAFINAFRMISSIVHEYPDFAVMWSPNDMCALNKPFEYYWPGDEYVDWVGVSVFMKKHFMADPTMPRDGNVFFMTGDFAYTTNCLKNITAFMEENNIRKPLAVSEGGTVTQLNYPGGGEIEEWSKSRIGYMYWYSSMRFPQLKMINYFNHQMDEELQLYNLHDRPELQRIINDALSNGQYKKTVNSAPDFTFKTLEGTYEQTTVPLYTYAYLPEETIEKVDYILDDETMLASCDKVPYKYVPTTQYLPEGTHTLTVRVTGSSGTIESRYKIKRSGTMLEVTKE